MKCQATRESSVVLGIGQETQVRGNGRRTAFLAEVPTPERYLQMEIEEIYQAVRNGTLISSDGLRDYVQRTILTKLEQMDGEKMVTPKEHDLMAILGIAEGSSIPIGWEVW